MLRFSVYSDGQPAPNVDLTGAYLVGSDGVALRAEIDFKKGEILGHKRTQGPAGLVLMWPVAGCGRQMLETTRLQERDAPYNLHVELSRSRLMRISQKREDWGLFDYAGTEALDARVNEARDLLIAGLQAERPADAAALADKSLALAVRVSEELSLFHADVFLGRRKQTGGFSRRLFGCIVDLQRSDDAYRRLLSRVCDFAVVPFSWRHIEPKEQELDWKALDNWIDWLNKNRIPIKGAGLVNFSEPHVPDWLYIWEHDFETVRDLLYEHIRRVINRYGQHVKVWDIISGVHAGMAFSFNFEQLME
ncbi:MAG TPA: endo-1,4-beta-xylanase, partial [Phycisphaerae bacterium]